MIELICSIIVTVCLSSDGKCVGGMQSEATVHGTLIASNDYKYVGNFSKATKDAGYIGDYSAVFVNKSDCVKVGGN